MKTGWNKPRIYALVANAKGARLYSREKSKIVLIASMAPQKKAFKAKNIAQWLETELGSIQVDRFVLIAPAAFLRALHKAPMPYGYQHIMAEIKKDLLSASEAALQAELKKNLWF